MWCCLITKTHLFSLYSNYEKKKGGPMTKMFSKLVTKDFFCIDSQEGPTKQSDKEK